MEQNKSKIDVINSKIYRALEICVVNLGKDDETTKEQMINCRDLMQRIATIELQKEARIKALDKAKQHPSISGYKEEYENEMKKLPRVDISKSKRYNDFEKFLNDINQPSGGASTSDEGMTVTETLQRADPFTKRPMVNPVRNNFCKHVYDKDSLINIIQLNSQVRCPYVGCTNKHRLRMADVTEDNALRIQFSAHPDGSESE